MRERDRAAGLAERVLERLAGLERDDTRDVVAARLHRVRDVAQDLAAADGRRVGPRRLRREAAADGPFDVARRARATCHNALAGGRVHLLEPLAARRRHVGAGDTVGNAGGNERAHHAVHPPSMTRFDPVMYDDASDSRNTIAPLYSSSRAMRPSGTRAA